MIAAIRSPGSDLRAAVYSDPAYLMLFKHLDEREARAQAEPTRVVSIQN